MTLVCDKANATAALKICSLRRFDSYEMTATSSDGNTHVDDINVCNDDANEYIEVDSATIYLLQKSLYGLWNIVQDVAWEIGFLPMDGNVYTLISSYVESLNSAFKIVRDYAIATYDNEPSQDVYSSEDDDNDTPPMISSSDMSDMSSSCESYLKYIATSQEDELALQSADLITDENIQRIDYDIKQVDIPETSHQSDTTEGTQQVVHTLTDDDADDIDESSIDDKSQTICSSHHDDEEEDSVDEFLQRNAHIIEGYFDENPEQDVAHDGEKDTDRNLSFSWMIVDKDGPMTRMSNSVQL